MLRLADAPPAREALVFVGTGSIVTYGELSQGVRARAAELVRPRSPEYVPLVTSTDRPFIVNLLAHFEVEQPVLLIDSRHTSAEQERVVNESRGHIPQNEDRVVLATSGSTGRPKLVVHTGNSLVSAARASEANLGWRPEGDRWYLSLPLAHIGGLALLLRCLLGHQTVVVGQAKSSEPDRLLDELSTQRVTLASFVPTQLSRLLIAWPKLGLPHLRAVLVGGASAAPELREQAKSSGVRTLTTYGLTEMSSQVATERFREPVAANLPRGFVGPPLPGVEVRVDESGRLRVRGPMAMRGYLNFEAPFDPDGYLVTQDLGHVDSAGNVYVFGRADNVIITGGENVAAEFVESALLSTAGVREACVVGISDLDWGAKVVAAVVLEPSISLTVHQLRLELTRTLPRFACPKEILFVRQLPLLLTGKVDRPQVRTWFEARPGPT